MRELSFGRRGLCGAVNVHTRVEHPWSEKAGLGTGMSGSAGGRWGERITLILYPPALN